MDKSERTLFISTTTNIYNYNKVEKQWSKVAEGATTYILYHYEEQIYRIASASTKNPSLMNSQIHLDLVFSRNKKFFQWKDTGYTFGISFSNEIKAKKFEDIVKLVIEKMSNGGSSISHDEDIETSSGKRKNYEINDLDSLESEEEQFPNKETRCSTCGQAKFHLLLRQVRDGKVDEIPLLLPLLDATHKICTHIWRKSV
eukprot:TRINITY_DN4410_c0_g1_i1.p1 TRINITY_DN4410_c0_g1~~TRINITY_DN4410_c0_g1_i1.p1  ORF type:complete len:200 (-),score=39.26 TRINITY_DN4410_c0_g1_i1:353-952(-)